MMGTCWGTRAGAGRELGLVDVAARPVALAVEDEALLDVEGEGADRGCRSHACVDSRTGPVKLGLKTMLFTR
jgi:hypothetical protein